MATMPPQAAQAADPSQGAQPPDQGGGGYEICVKVDGSGQISVGVEDASAEAAEDQSGDDDGGYTPASNIKAACQMVEQIFKNNGQMPGGQSQMSVQDAFGQGFQGAAG
jgi:hypothetical protein